MQLPSWRCRHMASTSRSPDRRPAAGPGPPPRRTHGGRVSAGRRALARRRPHRRAVGGLHPGPGKRRGLVLYLVAWAVLPADGPEPLAERPPAAGRARRTRSGSELALAVGCITLGALLLVRWITPFFPDQIVWPAVVAALGIGLVLARAGDSDRARWREAATRLPGNPVEAFRAAGWCGCGCSSAPACWSRASGCSSPPTTRWPRSGNRHGGAGHHPRRRRCCSARGCVRLVRQLGEERRERIRNEERADMAAHLHDSVLQTLALIQRHADEPQQARSLARRQERELRAWLYDGRRSSASDAPGTLATALDGVADEVEADHGVAVDVVVVGDCPLDDACRGPGGGGARGGRQRRPAQRADEVSVYAEVAGGAGRGVRPRTGAGDSTPRPSTATGADPAVDRGAAWPATAAGPTCKRSRRGHRGDLRVGADRAGPPTP